MSEKPKKKAIICERRTISFDANLYLLALQRMKEEGETIFSRYVQTLVRKDTALLRAEALNAEKAVINFAIAADTHESVDLPQDKSQGKYQNAAARKAAERAGAKTTKLSENLGSGSSTATTGPSRRAG
jgi:cobalamin biosynthesis Mg chelatase CobN